MFRHTRTLALIGLCGSLFLSTHARAQLDRKLIVQCRCENIPRLPVHGYLPAEKEAIELVSEMLEDMKKYARIRFSENILVRETACTYPSALLCGEYANGRLISQQRIIAYDNKYIKKINKKKDSLLTWVDRHILAHEIGHHVLGHLGIQKSFIPLGAIYQQETGQSNRKPERFSGKNIPALEIEADFFALWFLARTQQRFRFNDFINDFDTEFTHTAPKLVTSKSTEKKKPKSSVGTHLSLEERIQAMTQFWGKVKIERKTMAKANYFENAASAAYIELYPEHRFWDIGLVGGATLLGQPRFSVDNQRVDALLYSLPGTFNTYAGLYTSGFKWNSPLRYEADVAFSAQRYGTLINDGNSQRILEKLDLQYLTFFPRMTWSPLGQSNVRFSTNRVSFFVGLGPVLRLPLSVGYQNYAMPTSSASAPDPQLSVSPRVSLGAQLLKKSFLPRGYKVAVNYELQPIRLKTNTNPKALSHNLDVTVYYTVARW